MRAKFLPIMDDFKFNLDRLRFSNLHELTETKLVVFEPSLYGEHVKKKTSFFFRSNLNSKRGHLFLSFFAAKNT